MQHDPSIRSAISVVEPATLIDADPDWEFQKVLVFIAAWVAAVALAIAAVDIPPPLPGEASTLSGGYTYSLVLVLLPWGFLLWWFQKARDEFDLRAIGKAVFWNAVMFGVLWTALDIFLAHRFFTFPEENTHLLPQIPGYTWSGACSTIWTFSNLSCYELNIPLEEVVFYLVSAALLRMLYMWGTEDFFRLYTLPRSSYVEKAHLALPLVKLNKTLLVVGLVILATGIAVKKAGWHGNEAGFPYYLVALLTIVFGTLIALHTRVHKFTNSRAFLFAMALQVVISLVWEGTLALPYRFWNYQMTAMVGLTAVPWSNLAIEACFLWVSVGWSVMLWYEASKIKAVTGRSWPEVLTGKHSWLAAVGLSR
jgi:hypothetical protein